MILVAVITFQSNVCLSDDVKQKYSNVRLQQNEWIQVLKQIEEIKFDEHYAEEVWHLHVKVLFLQYCKASKKRKSRYDEVKKDPNATENDLVEAIKEDWAHILDNIGRFFRCNYRTTIFLTLYSSDGKELRTMKKIPQAYKDQTEIMPGETVWETFYIPMSDGQPKSWHVWVPK